MGGNTVPSIPVNYNVTNIGNGVVALDFQNTKSANSFSVQQIFHDSNKIEDLGTFSGAPILLQNLSLGIPYYIKIKANNDYGSSDYTEVLGIVPSSNAAKVLIVNAFDRTSGTMNTFDFIRQHGSAIHNSGYIFDATSNEAVINNLVKLSDYSIVDWILGEEGSSTSTFDKNEQILVEAFLKSGGRLLLSGSEIGYDLVEKGDLSDNIFYEKILKADYITDAAAGKQGTYEVKGVTGTFFENTSFSFDNGTHGTYDVDWPDGIKPVANAESILIFDNVNYDTNGGAGIAYNGGFSGSPVSGALVYLSIGFETIYPGNKRNDVMGSVLNYLDGPLASINDNPSLIPDKLRIISLYPNPSNRSIFIEFKVERSIWWRKHPEKEASASSYFQSPLIKPMVLS